MGYGGQLLIVVPELELISVFTGWNIYDKPSLDPGFALGRVLAALDEVKLVLVLAGLAVAVFLVDRLLLWMEWKGWIDYRRTYPGAVQPGAGRAGVSRDPGAARAGETACGRGADGGQDGTGRRRRRDEALVEIICLRCRRGGPWAARAGQAPPLRPGEPPSIVGVPPLLDRHRQRVVMQRDQRS